ncbi:hypothetical protein PIROE2DRAFT_58068 [Piromyces sp. E2]|nr:hypothetical protein PIROE2DRAFT_58068 [Piromyces sp. E2]|eukprot:OUM68394.1 hypothetical protein PIROE2DRAFT_58068 [Piromyces sp. E2]
MSEESAWQTFSIIKKQEEDKLLNSKVNYDIYRDASRQLNDIHVYDTDTDSEDLEYYRRELNKDDMIPTLDSSFVTPPKSSIDSAHSSLFDNCARGEEDLTAKVNNNDTDVSNTNDFFNKGSELYVTNREALLKQRINKARKEKKNGMESAWTKFIKKSIKDILKGYNIKQAIGKGYCGTIFKAKEYAIYQRLYGLEGMPKVLYYGRLEKDNIMIMELLGPSVEALFRLCHNHFSMKTICMIGKQLITRLEKVHERGIVYRDIKPENFLIGYINYSKPITNKYKKGEEVYLQDGSVGRPPVATVYLADFGLSEFYKNPVTNHYVPSKRKPPCGTPRYMSLNTHRCDQQTPRDDLESLCYCLMYLCFGGRLPWMGITAKTPEVMIISIGRTKASISIEQLCKTLPSQFKDYLYYVRALDYYDKPDYDYLRGLFDEILSDMGQEDDGDFDWLDPIRLHQEQKAKKQKMEREKEMKRVKMEKKKRETHEKKRKLSLSQDAYPSHPSNSSDHSTRNINGPCKKQTVPSPRTAEIEALYNKKRIQQNLADTVTSPVNVIASTTPSPSTLNLQNNSQGTANSTSPQNPTPILYSNSSINLSYSSVSSNSSSTVSTVSNNSVPTVQSNPQSSNSNGSQNQERDLRRERLELSLSLLLDKELSLSLLFDFGRGDLEVLGERDLGDLGDLGDRGDLGDLGERDPAGDLGEPGFGSCSFFGSGSGD